MRGYGFGLIARAVCARGVRTERYVDVAWVGKGKTHRTYADEIVQGLGISDAHGSGIYPIPRLIYELAAMVPWPKRQ